MSIFNKKKDDDKKDQKPEDKLVERKEAPKDLSELKPKAEKEKFRPSKEDTGNAYKILTKPLISEKVTNMGSQNKYVFAVAKKANKSEIKKAIRSLYGVEVIKVNIIRLEGRDVHYGKSTGRTKSWKKAIITLKQGDSIQLYEGV